MNEMNTNTKPRRVATAHLRMVAIETVQFARWGRGLSFWNGATGVDHWKSLTPSVRDAKRWDTPAEAFAARDAGEVPSTFRLRWADCGKTAQARRQAEGWGERTGERVAS